MAVRQQLAAMLTQETFVDCAGSVLDFDVQLPTADWVPWKSRVATVELDIQNVSKADVVIPTVDTVRHEHLLYALLGNGSNVILCGPV